MILRMADAITLTEIFARYPGSGLEGTVVSFEPDEELDKQGRMAGMLRAIIGAYGEYETRISVPNSEDTLENGDKVRLEKKGSLVLCTLFPLSE